MTKAADIVSTVTGHAFAGLQDIKHRRDVERPTGDFTTSGKYIVKDLREIGKEIVSPTGPPIIGPLNILDMLISKIINMFSDKIEDEILDEVLKPLEDVCPK